MSLPGNRQKVFIRRGRGVFPDPTGRIGGSLGRVSPEEGRRCIDHRRQQTGCTRALAPATRHRARPPLSQHRAAGRGDKAGHAFRVGLIGSRRGIEGRLTFCVPKRFGLALSRAGSLSIAPDMPQAFHPGIQFWVIEWFDPTALETPDSPVTVKHPRSPANPGTQARNGRKGQGSETPEQPSALPVWRFLFILQGRV